VTYTGSLGPVSAAMPIHVAVFRDADLTDRADRGQAVLVDNPAPYDIVLLENGPHYLVAFLDRNDDGVLDSDEPFTVYDDKTAPPGDPLPQDGSMVDVSFGDPPGLNTPTPTIAPATETPAETPTATPTPTVTGSPRAISCVGDCDGDGQVTVDELVLGVGIALGTTDVSECSAFDSDENGSVTVDELVQAMDNALHGCPET
jgi:hypothetical protein